MKLCSKSIDEIKMLNEKLAGDSNWSFMFLWIRNWSS
jgi:hypothetical protein